jgi:hypothetical protein
MSTGINIADGVPCGDITGILGGAELLTVLIV